MFRTLAHSLLLAAVLAMTGAHWAVLQSIAWTTMLAGNLRTADFPDAFARTFDGKHPCGLCKHIARGKQAEKTSDQRCEWSWPEFSYVPPEFHFAAPAHGWELRAPDTFASALPHAPPVPPPRSFPG